MQKLHAACRKRMEHNRISLAALFAFPPNIFPVQRNFKIPFINTKFFLFHVVYPNNAIFLLHTCDEFVPFSPRL